MIATATSLGYFTRSGTSFRVIVPRWSDHSVFGTPGAILDDDALAMSGEMVELLAGAPSGYAGDPNAMQVVLGGSNRTGQVGFYSPPEADRQAGRFWAQMYPAELEADAPYYHTSPGFDALVQVSIERGAAHELDLHRRAEESLARIRAANEERMARVALEERASDLAAFRAAEPPPEPRAVEASTVADVRVVLVPVLAALAAAAVGVWLLRPRGAA